jgi:hypothetical protein
LIKTQSVPANVFFSLRKTASGQALLNRLYLVPTAREVHYGEPNQAIDAWEM